MAADEDTTAERVNVENWKGIWERRQLDPSRGSVLAQLMAADGLDTGYGDVDETNWTSFVTRSAELLGLRPDMSVFEVGCGAGAFLYELSNQGYAVSGIDMSPALIDIARQALPQGSFEVAEAADFDVSPKYDVVLSCGVFLYFSSLDYARDVVARMVKKADDIVAIFDIPDAATKAEALAHRIEVVGGQEAYAARYEGLDHHYYDREWIAQTLEEAGLHDVHVADQHVEHYDNGRFRFNAWGRV